MNVLRLEHIGMDSGSGRPPPQGALQLLMKHRARG